MLPEVPLLIGQPSLAERITRALDIKGDYQRFLQPMVGSSLTLDDFTRAEYRYLFRSNLSAGGLTAAAVAAQLSHGCIGYQTAATPAAARLCRVQQIWITNTGVAAAFFGVGVAIADIAGFVSTGVAGVRDTRWQRNGLSSRGNATLFSGANAVARAETQVFLAIAAGATAFVETDFILSNQPTGFGVQGGVLCVFNSGTVNSPLVATFVYEEREMLSSEL